MNEHEHKYEHCRIEVHFKNHSSTQWFKICHECFIKDDIEGDLIKKVANMKYGYIRNLNEV